MSRGRSREAYVAIGTYATFFALITYTSRTLSSTKIPAVLPSALLHKAGTMAYSGRMSAAAKNWSTLALNCGPVGWLRSVVAS